MILYVNPLFYQFLALMDPYIFLSLVHYRPGLIALSAGNFDALGSPLQIFRCLIPGWDHLIFIVLFLLPHLIYDDGVDWVLRFLDCGWSLSFLSTSSKLLQLFPANPCICHDFYPFPKLEHIDFSKHFLFYLWIPWPYQPIFSSHCFFLHTPSALYLPLHPMGLSSMLDSGSMSNVPCIVSGFWKF